MTLLAEGDTSLSPGGFALRWHLQLWSHEQLRLSHLEKLQLFPKTWSLTQ